MAQPTGQVEIARSFVGSDDNMRMWARLYSRPDRTLACWLSDSWSEHGAPYWLPRLDWFEKSDEKLCQVSLTNSYAGGSSLNLLGEDTKLEPDRAKFIRKMLEKWELEWLTEEGKKA